MPRFLHIISHHSLNPSPPGQNGRHFANDIFKSIFINWKFWILIKNSLKFVPKGPNDNNPALVKIMAWRRIGDKTLSEPMLTRFTDAYMRHGGRRVKHTNHSQCCTFGTTVRRVNAFIIIKPRSQTPIHYPSQIVINNWALLTFKYWRYAHDTKCLAWNGLTARAQ